MMKKLWLSVSVIMVLGVLVYFTGGDSTVEAAKQAKKIAIASASCASCHPDLSTVLSKEHPPVKGGDLSACMSCHEPDFTGKPQRNAYSARMHLAHLPPKRNNDCTACHSWTPGRSFGLIGVKGSWGAPSKSDMNTMKEVFASWSSSQYTDNRHAKGGIVCAGCHGKDLPRADETVENPRCLECHGSVEILAKKTEPKDFPDRNPHKSHLGEINCTVCHRAHSPSKNYCLECHKNFDMKNLGGEKKK